jgi:four helix bundle suffix protein
VSREPDVSDPADRTDKSDAYGLTTASPEVAANIILCLAKQAGYLLWRQLRNSKKNTCPPGGVTEKLSR